MPQREGSPQISRVNGCRTWTGKLLVRHCYIVFADNIKIFWFSLQSSFLDESFLCIGDMNNVLIFIKIPLGTCKNTSFLICRSRKFQQNNVSYIFKFSKVCFWKILPVLSGKCCWLLRLAVQNLIKNKSTKTIAVKIFPGSWKLPAGKGIYIILLFSYKSSAAIRTAPILPFAIATTLVLFSQAIYNMVWQTNNYVLIDRGILHALLQW